MKEIGAEPEGAVWLLSESLALVALLVVRREKVENRGSSASGSGDFSLITIQSVYELNVP